jgi:hypothetical protein
VVVVPNGATSKAEALITHSSIIGQAKPECQECYSWVFKVE